MSGPSQRAYFTLPRLAGPPGPFSPAEQRKRLAAAAVLSFLLHAVVVVMPSPGTGAQADRAAPRALEIRLERSEPLVAKAEAAAVVPAPPVSSPVSPPAAPTGPAERASRGLDLLPVPAAPYFTIDRLTKPPLATSQPLLTVPRETARYVTGNVTLKIWVNEFGGVENVEVERSNLPSTVSSHAAAAFRKLHFAPGEIDGRAVGVLLRVEVAYVDGRVALP